MRRPALALISLAMLVTLGCAAPMASQKPFKTQRPDAFTGMACSEGRLIGLAYAFEQATKRRVPPPSTP